MTMQNLPELTQEQLNAIIAQHYMQQMQMQQQQAQQQAAVNSFWNDVAVRAAAKVVARGLFR